MNNSWSFAKAPSECATSNYANAPTVLVGACQSVVSIPADELSRFYRGYRWMAMAGMIAAIFVGITRLIVGVMPL